MTVVILSISTTATTPPMIAAVLSASEQFTVSVEIMMEWLYISDACCVCYLDYLQLWSG